MKVFIAGHKGLVGSSLVRKLPNSHRIITVNKTDLDLTNKQETEKFLNFHKPDAVIIAAALVGGILANSRFQSRFLTLNLEIQNSLINASVRQGVNNLIFLGSSCIYPKFANQPIVEESLLTGPLEETNEAYALAKIAGLKLCEALATEFGLNYFSLMPTNLYGPNDNFNLNSSHVPAALIRRFHEAKLSNKNEVVVWGSGMPLREFMHVDDLASACWFLLEGQHGGSLLNVGSGIEITIADFAKLVAKVIGYEGELIFDKSKPDGTPRKLMDSSKINNLGWRASIGLEQGLTDTYSWFVEALKKGEVRGIET